MAPRHIYQAGLGKGSGITGLLKQLFMVRVIGGLILHGTNFLIEHTLSILFSAQRNPQPSQTQQIPITLPAATDEHTHQPSLHSFWALPSQPSSSSSSNVSTSSPPSTAMYQAANCE